MSAMPLRVLVVADDPLVRGGLATFLSGQPDCTVVAQIPASEVVDGVDVYRPDVLLWDMGWLVTGEAGSDEQHLHIERLEVMREAGLFAVVLLPEPSWASEVWATGNHCLLLRESYTEQLVAALAAAMQGLVVLDEAIAATLFPAPEKLPLPPAPALTPREQEVLSLLAEGLPNKTIATRLQISDHTVKFHVNAVMSKLGAQSRTEAVVLATRHGWILL